MVEIVIGAKLKIQDYERLFVSLQGRLQRYAGNVAGRTAGQRSASKVYSNYQPKLRKMMGEVLTVPPYPFLMIHRAEAAVNLLTAGRFKMLVELH